MESNKGFASWDDRVKHFRASFKGGKNNENRHKWDSEKARAAVMKRWAKRNQIIKEVSENVVQQ